MQHIARLALASMASMALALPVPCSAQSTAGFTAWGQGLGKTVHPCPVTPQPSPPLPPSNNSNPYFGFNGNPAVTGFACQQVGWFDTSGGHWFMQNIHGLAPTGAPASCIHPQPSCRVNTVRLCNWSKVDKPSNPPGPFGGVVGPKGCEKLWTDEYPSPL